MIEVTKSDWSKMILGKCLPFRCLNKTNGLSKYLWNETMPLDKLLFKFAVYMPRFYLFVQEALLSQMLNLH